MKLSVRNTIYDAAGKIVAKSQGVREQKLKVKNPHLWDIGKGYLYTVKSEPVSKWEGSGCCYDNCRFPRCEV